MAEPGAGTRVAAYDIGSNSIKLTIARVDAAGHVVEEHSDIATVRLGHAVDRTGRLDDERVRDALTALERFSGDVARAGAERSIGVATEAVRIAENGQAFLDEIRQRFSIEVVKISGQREAELTYEGLSTFRTLSGPTLMVDIGGASTEFVYGDGPGIVDARSIPLGSGRLTDTWIESDPPSWAEIAAVRVAAADRIAQLALSERSGARMIVSGGTGGYLSAYLSGETNLTVPLVDAALAQMARKPSRDLAGLIGASPERARVLPAGVAIILAVADRAGPASIETAPSGLRVGLLRAAAKGELQ